MHWRRQAAVATVGAAACVSYALLHFAGSKGGSLSAPARIVTSFADQR